MMDALILASTGLLKAQSVDELFEIAMTEAALVLKQLKLYSQIW